MTKMLLVLAAAVVAFGAVPAVAHTVYERGYYGVHKVRHVHHRHYRTYPSYARSYWPPGLESHERSTTRQLNREQASRPPDYYYPQYSYRRY